MRYLAIAAYLGGWLITTALILRGQFGSDERGKRTRMVVDAVSVVCAFLLAAVWPLSALFLPIIRAGLRRDDNI